MKLGLNFGFQTVQAGQKSSVLNAEPQLIANSTSGKFTITAPVSKALNIAVGENVSFANNISLVEAAIQGGAGHDDIVAWANEQGVDLTTIEGQKAALDAFTVWFIAKGIAEYDSKGNPIMSSVRFTKEDKMAYIKEHADELLEANRDALIERLGNPDASDEELIASITPDDIESPKVPSFSGSKTSSTGSFTGVGCQLGFTDSAVWNALKASLDEETRAKKNRIFKVLLESPITSVVKNGYEDVQVTAYPIEYLSDEDVVARVAKA